MKDNVILIIDDEAQIRKLLSITLQSNNYKVIEASTGKQGLQLVSSHKPDLVLLDLGLPDESGHEILKHLREWFSNPIIIISVLQNEEDIIKALDRGADDYIVKPFRTGELLARIRSAVKKSNNEVNLSTVHFEDLSMDFANRLVRKKDQVVKLTATEYSLLSILVRNDGKVLTHQYLLQEVWGDGRQHESQYLRVFIAQLRKKIEENPNRPTHILTESSIGYRFVGSPL
jgi:two-component system, OmpR family, KDP operon response regulator KdpE